MWDGPGYRTASQWVEVDFANLRAGFRWSADRSDLTVAGKIAAHSAMIGFLLDMFEPIGWAEELLPVAAGLPGLPRLYTAASQCAFPGRGEAGLRYACAAVELADKPGYEPFHTAWTRYWTANAAVDGDIDALIETLEELALKPGLGRVIGLIQLVYRLPGSDRAERARQLASEPLSAARAQGNPLYEAMALIGIGRAFIDLDMGRAIDAFRQAELIAHEHRIPFRDAVIAPDAASANPNRAAHDSRRARNPARSVSSELGCDGSRGPQRTTRAPSVAPAGLFLNWSFMTVAAPTASGVGVACGF